MSQSKRELYDGLVNQAGAALREFLDHVDVSGQPEVIEHLRALRVFAVIVSQFHELLPDAAIPGWIQHLADADLTTEKADVPTPPEPAEAETETAAAASTGTSDAEWFHRALEHRGGIGSTHEICETQNELAPPKEEMDKSKIRYHAMQLHKKGLLVKEEPGPGTSKNYWRFPGVAPRPVLPKRPARRRHNNGQASVSGKPAPEGYNKNAKLRAKVRFIIFFVIQGFATKGKIIELINDRESGRYQDRSIKQEITDMTRHGLLAKWVFGSDHTYGNPEWPNHTEDGSILSIPNRYKPEGHRDPEFELQ